MKKLILLVLLTSCEQDKKYLESVQQERDKFFASCEASKKYFECVTLYENRYRSPCTPAPSDGAVKAGVAAGVTGAVVNRLLK